MSDWNDEGPAGRRHGSPAGVRFDDPWAATGQEPTRLRRLGGMVPRRSRNLVLAALAPVAVLVMVWSWSGDTGTEVDAARAVTTPEPGPAANPAPAPLPDEAGRRSYAVALPALRGLPPDAAPGTRLELWVAWDAKIRTKSRIQRLLEDVWLTRIIPPATPEGPPAALLSVPVEAVGDVLYGDIFGSFAVTVRG